MYNILLVDDEKAIRDNLPKLITFENYGFSIVQTASNGQDALEQLQRTKIDLLLLDVTMPVMDGLQLLRILRELQIDKKLQTVILSGYSDFEYAKTALRYGVRAYLTKPVDEDELIGVLTEIKKELDQSKIQIDSNAFLQKKVMFSDLLSGKRKDRACLADHFLLHAVPMMKQMEWQDLLSELLADTELAELLFVRHKSCVFTYLVPYQILENFHGDMGLFLKHLQYLLKEKNRDIALICVENLFVESDNSFRSDFDHKLYEQLTEVFYQSNCKDPENAVEREESFHEDLLLGKLQKAMDSREQANEQMTVIFDQMRYYRLNLENIQELNYRIYYMLLNTLAKRQIEQIDIDCIDLMKSDEFFTCAQWERMQRNRLNHVFDLLDAQAKYAEHGIYGEMMLYMEKNYRESITVASLADRFFMNPAYLGRMFQKETGKGIKQYLLEIRIKAAKRLLEETDLKIYEIADRVGFSESKYFVCKFEEEVGVSPMEYRRNSEVERWKK